MYVKSLRPPLCEWNLHFYILIFIIDCYVIGIRRNFHHMSPGARENVKKNTHLAMHILHLKDVPLKAHGWNVAQRNNWKFYIIMTCQRQKLYTGRTATVWPRHTNTLVSFRVLLIFDAKKNRTFHYMCTVHERDMQTVHRSR